MTADKFFAYAAKLLKEHPPHITDWSLVARNKRIGFEPGKDFDLSKSSEAVKRALGRMPAGAVAAMKAKLPTMAIVKNGWQMNIDTMGVYGNNYLK